MPWALTWEQAPVNSLRGLRARRAASDRSAVQSICRPDPIPPHIEHGYATTVDYLVDACRVVLEETGLLPHANAGALDDRELAQLRDVSASQVMMLETLDPTLAAISTVLLGLTTVAVVVIEKLVGLGRQFS